MARAAKQGGTRPGAGRRTLYPGKSISISVVTNADGIAAADALAGALTAAVGYKVSRSDAMIHGTIETLKRQQKRHKRP